MDVGPFISRNKQHFPAKAAKPLQMKKQRRISMLYPLYFELLTVLKIIAFFHCFLFYTQNFGSRCASLTAFSETDPDEKQNKKYKNQIPIYQK